MLSVALAVMFLVAWRGGAAPGPDTPGETTSVNRIAVVESGLRIRSFNPDGTDPRQVSPEQGLYTWPTWSPLGDKLVFSGVVTVPGGEQQVILFEYDANTHEHRRIHEGDPGFAGLLANGVVHYPIWSPDGEQIAFVVVTREHGLTLFLNDLVEGSDSEYVLDKGPLWMSWSDDSAHLMVHRSDRHFLVNAMDPVVVTELGVRSTAYRVPAWKPGEPAVAFVPDDRGLGFAVYEADVVGEGLGTPSIIEETSANAAFLWSADGGHLAIADEAQVIAYLGQPMLVYSQIRILDSVAYHESGLLQDDILAYFWSPDGAKIAYVSMSEGRGPLRWTLLDVSTGELTRLVDFVPSAEQLPVFQFFDQYAYSHSPWSPDSRHLVFAGSLSEGAAPVSMGRHPGHEGSHVFTVDTGPTLEITIVAEGLLGFWSP